LKSLILFFWVLELRHWVTGARYFDAGYLPQMQESNTQVKRLLASSRLSVHMKQLGSHWTDVDKI
jgi:hypothetical protein